MIVFDMAGTTVNEDNVVYKTVQKAINEAGFPVTLNEVLAQGAGKEKLQAIKSVLDVYANNTDDAVAQTIYENFIAQLSNAYATLDVSPQPNAVSTFAALRSKGIIVVLDTGYDRPTAQSLLDKLGWKNGVEFDALITASDVEKNRPHPDMILLAMQQFNIDDGRAVAKVGDSTIDIKEGQNAHCGLSIGITTGAHTFDQLQTAHPDHIINDLSELINLLN
ncbi:MAG: phosphonatase-like hydrolase [Niabella sp.]|nr:phosphonatase-like hydrolase [Niabella sp.]